MSDQPATYGLLTREYLSVFLYDWNQDGSPRISGTFIVHPEGGRGEECRDVPAVGEEVILYGDGLGVVVRVTEVSQPLTNGHVVCHTDYDHRALLRVTTSGVA